MIGLVRGELLRGRREGQVLIVTTSGVGYEVAVSARTLGTLTGSASLGGYGRDCSLLIYTRVSESAIALYGFESLEERDLFYEMIKVDGVGPSAALAILGAASPIADVRRWLAGAGVMVTPKGVGPKTLAKLRETFGAVS